MDLPIPLQNQLDGARRVYDNLNERERKMVAVLGVVLGAVFILLPLYLMGSSIADIEDENRETAAILREIAQSRATLRAREAEREAAEQRYARPAPKLGTFVEQAADEQGLRLREINDQPDKAVGNYTRRSIRATLPKVSLKPAVHMMAAISNSPYPVAIDSVHIEHFRKGEDEFNVELGVIAYDKKGTGKKSTTSEKDGR